METDQDVDSDHRTPLTAETCVADGRYRLLEAHGRQGDTEFWRATDTVMDRDVALSVVPAFRIGNVKTFCARTAGAAFDRPGAVARVFDIVDDGQFVVVVSEWTCGWSLAEFAALEPSPAVVARAVLQLAVTTRRAHHRCASLSLDGPARLRVDPAGNVMVAFPAETAQADTRVDVAGLAGVLYALLTSTWPGGADGWPPTPRDIDRSVVSAGTPRPNLGPDLAILAKDTADGQIATARAFVSRLELACDAQTRCDTPDDDDAGAETADHAAAGFGQRDRVVAIAALGVAVVVGLGAAGWTAGNAWAHGQPGRTWVQTDQDAAASPGSEVRRPGNALTPVLP